MPVNWAPIASAAIAAFVFFFGVFKWHSHIKDENEKLKTEAREKQEKLKIEAGDARHAEFTKILEEHKQEFKKMGENIQKVESELVATRDEMHADYAKVERVDGLRLEIKDDFDKVFKRLSSISENLNRLIGSNGHDS